MVHGQSRRLYDMGSATACFELGLFSPLLTEQIKEHSICLLHLQTIHKQDATAMLLDVENRIQNNPNQLRLMIKQNQDVIQQKRSKATRFSRINQLHI